MNSRKVMVVDDNALIRKIVDNYLRERGYEVLLCDGPFGVVNKVREQNPDVILMDLNMPGLNGRKLAELVNGARSDNGCRLIVFSSEDESVQTELVRKGLADDYFVKTNSIDGLDKKIDEVLGSRQECFAQDH